MKTFKTPKGTELPILDLRGKDYLQVAHRLVWFREQHPDWSISTEIVSHSADGALAKATICNEKGFIIATSHKTEDKRGFADFIEKAETGAIGRALAACGFGTQFAPELDEAERLVDSPVNRAKTGARAQFDSLRTQNRPIPKATQMPEGSDALTHKQLDLLRYRKTQKKVPDAEYIKIVKSMGGVDADFKIPFDKVNDVLGALDAFGSLNNK